MRVRLPPPCPIREGVLGVDPRRGTRGEIVNKDEGFGGGAGIQPDVDILLNQRDRSNPDPVPPSFDSSCIAKFVGYFRNSSQKSPSSSPPKSYAQVLQSQPEMNQRGGFGRDRFGRGAGRDAARGNVWQRIQGQGQGRDGRRPDEAGQELGDRMNQREDVRGGSDGSKGNPKSDEEEAFRGDSSSSAWERAAEQLGSKDERKMEAGKTRDEGKSATSEVHTNRNPLLKSGCSVCGLKNHTSEDCRRREFCEMCGFANHGTLDCKKEPLWNMGPELCAAQVPDQSFFYIDEHIDMKTSKDKSSTAIIFVVKGELTAKQIEDEFCSIISHEYWKWSARAIAKNKYDMRFPNAKMVHDYSRFKLGVKEGDELMIIEPWNSSMGAKGQLQQVWFKVSGIPIDQRSLRTISKVGGLGGKTMAIDEQTRFKPEFVRVKIACRDITKVPSSAECNLGLFIYDFFFDLEASDQLGHNTQNVATKVGDHESQPSQKKMRTEDSMRPEAQKGHESAGTPRGSGKGGNTCGHVDYLSKKVGSTPGNLFPSVSLKTVATKDKGCAMTNVENNCFPLFSEEEIIPAAIYEPQNDNEKETWNIVMKVKALLNK
ncbi:hypothetical protein PVAP13_8KG244700 [Panicum virgatum]|uniref:DUF4283 domain-containing protein n=1 Tax=Panicum virgatum TaxID=38727 RepID=A0A8T0PRF6_PANVG|nr:hypothetical protein PVAP13_8KG244700 [Panicum virgatum]